MVIRAITCGSSAGAKPTKEEIYFFRLLGSFSDEVKDNEVDGQENLEWSSEETLSENDMTDEESDLEPEEMNVDEEGETEDGTDESGI